MLLFPAGLGTVCILLAVSNVDVAILSEAPCYNVQRGLRTLSDGIVEDRDELIFQMRWVSQHILGVKCGLFREGVPSDWM